VTWPQEVCDQTGQPGGRNDSERKERSSHGTTRDRIGEDITTRGDEGQAAARSLPSFEQAGAYFLAVS
jgi:hypothetical protein